VDDGGHSRGQHRTWNFDNSEWLGIVERSDPPNNFINHSSNIHHSGGFSRLTFFNFILLLSSILIIKSANRFGTLLLPCHFPHYLDSLPIYLP
jgi:hypothetical protein